MSSIKYRLISNGKELLHFLNNNSSKQINSSKTRLKIKYLFSSPFNKPKYIVTSIKNGLHERIDVSKNTLYKDSFSFHSFKYHQKIAKVGYFSPDTDNNLQLTLFYVTNDPFCNEISDNEVANAFVSFLENTKDENFCNNIVDY